MEKMKLKIDDNGFPRATFSPPYEVIGWWLEQDIQSDGDEVDELLDIIDSVIEGTRNEWEGTGNAHTLSLKKDRANIVNEFCIPEQSCEILIIELRNILVAWQELLRRLKSNR